MIGIFGSIFQQNTKQQAFNYLSNQGLMFHQMPDQVLDHKTISSKQNYLRMIEKANDLTKNGHKIKSMSSSSSGFNINYD